jgi:hypothetical protein
VNNNTINATRLETNQYINVIKVSFENIFPNPFPTNSYLTKYLINDNLIDGYYVEINSYNGLLYFITPNIINITSNNLIYQLENINDNDSNSATTWNTSPKIIDTDIITLKEVNYIISGRK